MELNSVHSSSWSYSPLVSELLGDHPSPMCLIQCQPGPRDHINSYLMKAYMSQDALWAGGFGGIHFLLSFSFLVLVVGAFSLAEGAGKLVEG